jgi:phage terminase large subunit
VEIRINDKFKPLWDSECPIFIVTGGRGSGKSFAVGDFIENLTFEANHKILFTRFTLTAAHISVIPEFQEKIAIEDHLRFFSVNKTDIINKVAGSSIIFRGLKTSSGNQTAALKSIQGLTTWVLDEAEELLDEDVFDKISDSIRQKGMRNRIILVLNPTNKTHWIYKRFFEERAVNYNFNGEKEGICYIHTTYQDNVQNLSDEFLERIEWDRINRPDRYNHHYLGQWLDAAEGVIYTNWEIGEFNTSLQHGFGQDFGFNDPDAFVKVAIDHKSMKIYLDECIYQSGLKPNDLKALMRQYATSRDLIVADWEERRMIAELEIEFNIHKAYKYAGSVNEGIKLIQDYKLVVTEKSINLIRELNNYVWLDKKSDTPIDDYNHMLDSVRYYVMYILFNKLARRPVMKRAN